MFKAVRDRLLGFGSRLGAAWHDLRGRGMLRLFLFEFTVVLLGVLAAQGLQNWVREREEHANLDATLTQVRAEVGTAHHGALVWQAAVPCLRERVDSVMRRAAEGGQAEDLYIARPTFWIMRARPIPEDTLVLMGETMDPDEVFDLSDIVVRTNTIGSLISEISSEWEQFARINAQLGPVSQGDRDAVRAAGGRIRSMLRSLEINAQSLVEAAERRAIPATQNFGQDDLRRSARSCDELWRWNETAIPVDGEAPPLPGPSGDREAG